MTATVFSKKKNLFLKALCLCVGVSSAAMEKSPLCSRNYLNGRNILSGRTYPGWERRRQQVGEVYREEISGMSQVTELIMLN